MSASEETLRTTPAARPRAPLINRFLDAISSVRVGVVTLVLLVILSMAGMLIVQQNVEGFEPWYAGLTPSEKVLFGTLGLFDVYHAWYYYLLLLFLSLNIILASIDRFPSAWSYISRPKVKGTRGWLENRPETEHLKMTAGSPDQAARELASVFKANRLRPVTTVDGDKTYVFGQSGVLNRLGAYVVHVFLLTLFLGHFVALTTGFDADVRMVPGAITEEIQLIQYGLDNKSGFKKERFGVQLPFSIECTDIQQRLIDPAGSIDITNTLDWRTQMKIRDPQYGELVADVSMNRPVSYRGYRFFQASTIPVGNARNIKLELTPQSGGAPVVVDLARKASTSLPDGTQIEYDDFMPDFTFGADGRPDTRSGEYNNPVAVLNVTPAGGERSRVFAFAQRLPDNVPVAAPKAGYRWRLAEYEKSPMAHVLSIKYDPYDAAFIAWYIGGFGLIGALGFVFFVSHRRVWAEITEDGPDQVNVVLAGESNRNHAAFTDKFRTIVDAIRKE